MAKGRKLASARSASERFLGNLGYSHGAAGGSMELREDDVWSMGEETAIGENWDNHSYGGRSHPLPPRADSHRQVGGLSLAFDESDGSSMSRIVHQFRAAECPRGRNVATSAPVEIPDWSRIHRVDSVESLRDLDDDESELVPPHEYLARSQKMAANSVFEGVGRTLKGRDLSRVRDAVWSQTGFYG